MVKFEYNIDGKLYKRTMPTKLAEMTIGWLEELSEWIPEEPTRLDYIAALCKTPMDHIKAMPEDLLIILNDAIEFMFSELVVVEDMRGLEFEPIGQLRLDQFEHWRLRPTLVNTVALLHSGDYSYSERMAKIDDYKSMPADIAVYCRNFYNKSFEEHAKKFSYLYQEYEPTGEEAIAGYDELAKWGVYSTYEQLAGGDIFKMQEVVKLKVDEVYYFLTYQKTKINYQKNLTDAIQRNH